jgi:hypothetical protein
MALFFACMLFLALGAATLHPPVKHLYARNPPFTGMVPALCAWLAAEAEFQRGNIGRGDPEDILREWSLKKDPPAG